MKKNYIARVLDVAKAYDHTQMPVDVRELKADYERLQNRLSSIEEAARKADEWAMTAGAGTGWGPMATIHKVLRAALDKTV